MSNPVEIYSQGLCHASVCVPKDMPREEILRHVPPSGTQHGWRIAEAPNFKGGEPNPCPCNDHPDSRLHYLLEC